MQANHKLILPADVPVKRLQSPFGRLYFDGSNLLPSVTSILTHTSPEENKLFLEKFQRNNQHYCELAKSRGNSVHNLIEQSILHGVDYALSLPDATNAAVLELFLSVYNFIENSVPIASELRFFIPTLGYAGTIDYVGYCKLSGKVIVYDWKTTMKAKKYYSWGTYPHQLSAYIQAANHILKGQIDEPIDTGLIIRACPDSPPQIYQLEGMQIQAKLEVFKRKKRTYYMLIKEYLRDNQGSLEWAHE